MRPKKHETTGSADLFRARLEQIINMKHELVQLAGKIDWEWIDGEIAPLYSDKGRPGIETRFVIGLLLLKHIYGLSDEGVAPVPLSGRRGNQQPFHSRVAVKHDFPFPSAKRRCARASAVRWERRRRAVLAAGPVAWPAIRHAPWQRPAGPARRRGGTSS